MGPLKRFCPLFTLSAMAFAALPARAEVPPFFKIDTIASGVKNPTCLVHLPDGRILVNELGGALKIIKDGKATAIFSLPVSKTAEQGLLKVICHPGFNRNGWLYLFYTTPDKDHHNIDRVALGADNSVSGQTTLIQLPKITNVGLHNGSAMAFGKDGMLYVGRGEDVTASWAPLWDTQRGKILRFTEEGKPAPGNPHYDKAGAGDEERSIWARGFRNPWTLTYDSASGRLFEGDVGNLHEEINDVTHPDPAKDFWYGYGPNFPPGDGHDPTKDGSTIDPLYYYKTGSIGCAVLGELPLTSPATLWPAQYKNRIYFADYCNSWIRSVPMKEAGTGVDVNAEGSGMEVFAKTGFYNPLGLSQGIDGNLYLVGYGNGQVYRIRYDGVLGLGTARTPSGRGLRARMAGDGLRLEIAGALPAGKVTAALTIRDAGGRVLFRSNLELRDGQASLKAGKLPKGFAHLEMRWLDRGRERAVRGYAALP